MTPEQTAAVEARGHIIVSASAGSGKTRVMIERLVSLILKGVDVRNVLCVTFTNKAAAQMMSRLRSALLDAVSAASEEDVKKLKAQLNALPLADISTIHAFCGRLVRTHFYLLGIDPTFRIVSPEDSEGKTLSARAAAEAFDDAYEQGGAEFGELLAVYFRKNKDARLRTAVLDMVKAVRGEADYRAVLEQTGKEENTFAEACRTLAENFRFRAGCIRKGLLERKDLYAQTGRQAAAVCEGAIDACEQILAAAGLFDMSELEPPAIKRMPPTTKAEGEELALLKYLSGAVKAVKALYAELHETDSYEEELSRYEDSRRRACALAALALKYDEIYTRLKREANILDYEDLEHFALEILKNEDARRELNERYRYVFVDEYQDVNPVQERILFGVGGEDVFLVGDAKQAIYGFRGSRSKYFLEKERELPVSLRLTSNFRSAAEILEAVNRVFAPLIEGYVPMRGGDLYGQHRGDVRFHRQAEESEEEEQAPRGVYSVLTGTGEKTDALSEQIADLVVSEYGRERYDTEEKKMTRVTYGDIAILVRKNVGLAENVVAALTRRGIPVSTSSRVNVCDCFEVSLLIDFLKLIDNAEQDIPYASALLSAVGGFTEAELVQIRLSKYKSETFRGACALYRANEEGTIARKLNAFHERLENLRMQACVRSAEEILSGLLAMGLEEQIAAKAGGRGRLARVRRFLSEAGNAGSVHDFLARLKACDYRVDFSESAGDNAVSVLTIHASKGLEYPVVILAGMDGDFHGADHDDLLWTEEFRAAPRSFNVQEKLTYETVVRRAARAVQLQKSIQDECNLLYVAMTRACYRLHVILGKKDPAIAPCFAKRFSDFFNVSALADYFVEDEERELPPLERKQLVYRPDAELLNELRAVYGKPYGFGASTNLPVKSSATELLQGDMSKPARVDTQPRKYTAGYSADTGTAYHAFLQHVAFGANAAEELGRMRRAGLISEEQAALLDLNKLEEIMRIPCLKSLAGKRVLREQTFLVSLPACEIYGTDAEDEVVFQGAIDLLVEDAEGYLIIDYKYSSHGDARIRSDYAPQIRLYRKAVSRILKIDETTVRARIVNIAQCREIEM